MDTNQSALSQIDSSKLPLHVGVIMDGNGRWAQMRSLPRTSGHSTGVEKAKEIVKAASDAGIKYLTLYIFSTENWKRTEQEVGFLMNLIHAHLRSQFEFYKENKIRLKLLGDISTLPKQIQEDILNAQKDTESFTGLTLCMAINYGGRDEIIRSIKKLALGKKDFSTLTEQDISENFDVGELPDADLIIRTGGEQRLSNFLLWHSAYAEFIFKDTLWPDYSREEFYSDIASFQNRTRRFGAVL